jgi:hypothetical protein
MRDISLSKMPTRPPWTSVKATFFRSNMCAIGENENTTI